MMTGSSRRLGAPAWLLVLPFLVGGCPSRTASRGSFSPKVGQGQPVEGDFRRVGKGRLRLSELRGKPVAILFFATWCVPCQLQADRLQRARAALGNHRVRILAVSVDLEEQLVAPFVTAAGFNFPAVYGGAHLVRGGGLGPVRGVPRVLILDRRGRKVVDFPHIVETQVLFDQLKFLLAQK